MSLLEMICKELGVEVGEKWLGDDGYEHQISKKGTLRTYIQQGASVERCEISNELWLDIVAGELKPVWEPQKGEMYCLPDPTSLFDGYGYGKRVYSNSEKDKWALKNKLMFRTKQEAIECANKMLKAIKE